MSPAKLFLVALVMSLGLWASSFANEGVDQSTKYSAINSLGGRWEGHLMADNPDVIGWLGIEYGRAKRFELSTVVRHTGVQDAVNYGPCCIQSPAFLPGQYNGTASEDCLFLNVYAPKVRSELLPVVIYIHGGAFTFGSGSSRLVNPARYTDRDVVLVSINYRLNLLGFMALPNLPYTNFGLYDQRVAMEWVRDNIEAFGGDKTRVTLIGDSAGAISILHHLTSPLHMADPLFHRAIVISAGLFAGPEYTLDKAHRQNAKIAFSLGCAGPGPHAILTCLQALPAAKVRVVTTRFPTPFIATYPMALRETGMPVNDRTYFPDLIDSLSTGKYDRNIPVIIGSDLDEGTMFAAAAFPLIYPDEALFNAIVKQLFEEKAPLVLERYGVHRTGNARKSFNELTSHLFTSHGTCQASRFLSQFSKAPIYRYGNYHVFRHTSNPNMGAFHTAAHGLFLRPSTQALIFPSDYDQHEIEMSDQFGKLLMAFAAGKDFQDNEWPKFDTKQFKELHIGPNNSSRLEIGAEFQREDCDFWANLYPPHGLLPPMYHGDLYQAEVWYARLVNEGFWIAAANIRLVKSGSLLALVSIILLLIYRFSPLRKVKMQAPATAGAKKAKKD